MPDFEKNLQTGLMIGASLGAGMELWRQLRAIRKKRQKYFDFNKFAAKTAASMALSAVGSTLPDFFEPNKSYKKVFHSWLTALGLGVAEFYLLTKELDEEELSDFIVSRLAMGYLTHLSIDD